MKRKQRLSWVGTGIFTFLSLFYVAPIVVVLFNSFKKKAFINLEPFKLPTEQTWTGLDNYTTAIDQYWLFGGGWLDGIHHRGLCAGDPALYLHVRLVYYPGEKPLYQGHVPAVCVLHGGALPNGDVYPVPGGRPPGAEYSLGHHHCLPGLWRRTGRVHVLRICKSDSHRN